MTPVHMLGCRFVITAAPCCVTLLALLEVVCIEGLLGN